MADYFHLHHKSENKKPFGSGLKIPNSWDC